MYLGYNYWMLVELFDVYSEIRWRFVCPVGQNMENKKERKERKKYLDDYPSFYSYDWWRTTRFVLSNDAVSLCYHGNGMSKVRATQTISLKWMMMSVTELRVWITRAKMKATSDPVRAGVLCVGSSDQFLKWLRLICYSLKTFNYGAQLEWINTFVVLRYDLCSVFSLQPQLMRSSAVIWL